LLFFVVQVTDNQCGQQGITTIDSRSCNTGICQNWNSWTEVGACRAPCGESGVIRVIRYVN